MLSSASHAHFVEVTVGGMMQADAVSVHSWVSCSLSSKAIGGISTSGSLLVSALLVWQCLMQSATSTSIPVISTNSLSWTVFLIPCLISWISTLSVLAIRSAKTLEMIAFSVLVKDRFVEASSLARSHCWSSPGPSGFSLAPWVLVGLVYSASSPWSRVGPARSGLSPWSPVGTAWSSPASTHSIGFGSGVHSIMMSKARSATSVNSPLR